MISVEEALARTTEAFSPLPGEEVSLEKALGRVLAEDAYAAVSHPQPTFQPWTATPCVQKTWRKSRFRFQ